MPPAMTPAMPPCTPQALPRWLAPAALAISAWVLAACGEAQGQGPAGGAPPPTPVGVVTVQPGNVALQTELPGRLEASRVAQVRARATGIVAKRQFTEGAEVRAGQMLFKLDAAPYVAARDAAQAAVARAQATLAQADANLQRNRPLAEARAISQADWVSTQTAQQQARADLASAQASLKTASINLGYCEVRAPIAGRVGRALVSEGALVSATEATQMALVQQINPLYLNFTQPVAEVARLRRAFESGTLKRAGAAGAAVQVVLEDGSAYPLPGRLLFTDLSVDATSGQVTLRAELPNPQGELLPGQYVKVRLQQASTDAAFLLPQQAVTRGVAGDTVLVVGADKIPAARSVKIAAGQGNQWVVLDGLKPGEQVVVDGFQKIRPKSPVQPVPWSPTGSAGAPPNAGAPAAPAAASAPPNSGAPAAPAAASAPR